MNDKKIAEWIPVSERLPATDGDYIISTEYGFVMTEQFDVEASRFDTLKINGEVTAWQPLPEPYKENNQ